MIAGFTSNYEAHHLGRTLNMGRGEGVILTGAEPASFGGPAQNSINLLRVPVRLLSPLVADLESAYGRAIPANNPALRLLVTYVDILEEAGTFAVPELDGRLWLTFTTSLHLRSERRETRRRSPTTGVGARHDCARSRKISQTASTNLSYQWRQSPHGIGLSRGGSSGCLKARTRPLPSMSLRSDLSARTGC